MENVIASKHPIFNGEYEILSSLGEGNTSKVYLARSLKDPKKKIALKLLREEFLQRDKDSIKSVEQEIQILNGLKHDNIVNILGYGSDGYVKKPSGREIKNLVYIKLEYVTGGLLFDVCQTIGGMGEDSGRYFLSQMIDVLTYLNSKNVVHRDLKLENILVDDQMNLKVADFGFATYKKINKLNSYRGTMTYMAPEIKEGKTYDGKQIDIFSTGVIMFIIVQGIFPFKEAKKDEYFYNLLLQGKYETYWKKVGG
jgi:serine/threonine protein kinase